jgi:DNA-binding NtrC family response regulator
MRVLVVEDDLHTCLLVVTLLKTVEAEAVTVDNGLDALKLLDADSRFDAVLTDVRMPKMDGLSFASAVRERFPKLPIIVMSVHFTTRSIAAEVPDDLMALPKPFTRQQLIDCLDQIQNIAS